MIIMINGAYGVGKSTIAEKLQKEINNSMIFDPEEMGYMLRAILPHHIKKGESPTGDFQDFLLWKEITVEMAKRLIRQYKMHLIVPMTIRKPDYFQYIYNGFKNTDEHTFHFCLTASKATIYERLRKRGEQEGNWCFQQTDKCLEAFNDYNFEEYINTEKHSIDEIMNKIGSVLKDCC